MILHISILDEDPVSVITPLVDKNIPSDGVVFVYTHNQAAMLESLTKQIRSRGIEVYHWLLPDLINVDAYKTSLLELVEQYNSSELWFNASTGNRLVNLAAYEVFRLYNFPIFCIDPRSDLLHWVYPDNRQTFEVGDTIKVKHYLESYGLREVTRISVNGVQKDIAELTTSWIQYSNDYKQSIRELNYLAYTADNEKLLSEKLSYEQQCSSTLNTLIDDLINIGYCQYRHHRLEFTNEEARFFANGGWLEIYVFMLVRRLSQKLPRLQDEGYSVEIERKASGGVIRNELDIAFLYNNLLHVVECKTKHFKYGEGNDLIYKLDSLVDSLGGVHAKGMVVSFLPLAKSEKRRAKDLGIEIIDFSSLHVLESKLMSWLT